MGGREALVHLGAKVAAQAIDSFGHGCDAFRHGADVMPKILRDHVEMATGLGGSLVDFLAKLLPHLLHIATKASHLMVDLPTKLLPHLAHLTTKASHLLTEASQGLVEVGASFGVHAATLLGGQTRFQACQKRYAYQRLAGSGRPSKSAVGKGSYGGMPSPSSSA